MITVKVEDTTHAQLNWLVAKVEGVEYSYRTAHGGDYNGWTTGPHVRSYSVSDSEAGPIIDKERIATQPIKDRWIAGCDARRGRSAWSAIGPTRLIAAMRCYVMSRLGDIAEVPSHEELLLLTR